MMKTLPKIAFTALAALSFAGCVNVLPKPLVPNALIELPADRAKAPTAELKADVSVLPADSSRAFAGVDIAVRNDHEIVYLADVRWADAAPRLLQGAVVESLSQAKGTGQAAPAQLAARVDYDLRWRIIDLSVGSGVTPVRAEVEASLLDSATRRIVAQERMSSIDITPKSKSSRDRAAALALAAQVVADKVAAFVAEKATPPAPDTGAAAPAPTR